jgi:hypothetical protein
MIAMMREIICKARLLGNNKIGIRVVKELMIKKNIKAGHVPATLNFALQFPQSVVLSPAPMSCRKETGVSQ